MISIARRAGRLAAVSRILLDLTLTLAATYVACALLVVAWRCSEAAGVFVAALLFGLWNVAGFVEGSFAMGRHMREALGTPVACRPPSLVLDDDEPARTRAA